MQTVNELAFTDLIQGFLTHTGQDAHGHDDVGRVGELDTQLGVRISNRSHAEGHDVHGAALHAATVVLTHFGAHLFRIAPVVGRAGTCLSLGADEGTRFNAGNVGWVGECQVGVGTLLFVELN